MEQHHFIARKLSRKYIQCGNYKLGRHRVSIVLVSGD
jgi:hypothetical protein